MFFLPSRRDSIIVGQESCLSVSAHIVNGFQKINFHVRRVSNKLELSVESPNMLLKTVWHKHASHPKSVAK